MSPYRRNVVVGATVLFALIVLGWMILRFSGGLAAPFTPRQFIVQFIASRADGIADGSPVLYRGVDIGRVVRVQAAENMLEVLMDGRINENALVPGNVVGTIRMQSALGTGASIILELEDPQPQGRLQSGQTIHLRYVGLDLFPTELGGLADDLRLTSQQLRESNMIPQLRIQVEQAGELMSSIQQIVDDPQMREDLRLSLANIRTATDSANRISANLEQFTQQLEKLSADTSQTITAAQGTIQKTEGHVGELAKQANDRMLQLARLLDQFQSITVKIDQGQGTAGQLINDPRLYESLVDTSRQLNATVVDLGRLIQQWEQEGVHLRLR
jgi:phospholipid/cholesterol/gamma-HCH transport system substrate-binding protein